MSQVSNMQISLMSGITLRIQLLQHGTLLNVMWQPGWEGSLGRMNTCVCMAEFLCRHLKLSQYCSLAIPKSKLKVKKKRIKPLQVFTCSADIYILISVFVLAYILFLFINLFTSIYVWIGVSGHAIVFIYLCVFQSIYWVGSHLCMCQNAKRYIFFKKSIYNYWDLPLLLMPK